MGLKKKLMMQAAAAAAAEAGAAEGLGESETVWEAGDDPLWLLQSSLDTVGALSDDLGNATSGSEPSGDVGGAAATPAAAATGQSKYKWSTTLDAQFVFDFKAAVPKETIGAMCWGRDVVGVMRSEAGAEGVFFVQTVTGAVVVKGSKSMAAEVFSSLLGTALGVFCPKWRVIATGSPEGKAMIGGLSAKDASGRVQLNLGSLTHVLLKEFLPGAHLGEIGGDRASEIFGGGGLSENGRSRLRELGRIIALDVLCNNGDRFPLIWDNRGNPGNVMLARGPGKAVSIDSQIQPIDGAQHPAQFEAYLQKVEALVRGLREEGTSVELPEFKRVREKLLEFTTLDVGQTGGIELQKGFLEVSANKAQFSVTKEVLESWRQTLAAYEPPLVGIGAVDPAFVLAVWNIF